MAGVFLSYDRDDTDKARPIALALEKAGHSVWWDLHVRGGAQFSKVIEEALKAADAVVVLWSKNSVESPWVRDEAAAGRDTGRLVPVTIDGTEPPLGFRQYQTIDLSRWTRRAKRAALQPLLDAIGAVGELPEGPGAAAPPIARDVLHGRNRRIRYAAFALLLVLAIAAAAFVWRPWSGERVTLVAARPADPSPASRDLARDLTVKLGSLATAHSEAMRMISYDDASRQKPDLLFEASSTPSGNLVRANVVLLSRENRALLWSNDFEQPSSQLADLKQQIAFTSGRVLRCTLDGMQPGQRLKLDTLKVYLNACANLADAVTIDTRPVIPLFASVVREAPSFKPAWGKLLLAEADTVSLIFGGGEVDPRAVRELRAHIRDARQLDPNMPEAMIAEAALAPPRSFHASLALFERAARTSADDPAVLAAYSLELARVGRRRQAVELTRRAAALDSLSPAVLGAYIQSLAYAGRFEAAERELRKAERLWPGTAMIRDAQFRYHYRYGDPKLALAMKESDTPGGMPREYLRTRIAPTEANKREFRSKVTQVLARMENPRAGIGFAIVALGEFGGEDELFPLLLNWPKPDDLAILGELYFRPELRNFRRQPRFMQVAKRAGLVDYWRSSGKWPDFCFEPDQPYDCKEEAAKLKA